MHPLWEADFQDKNTISLLINRRNLQYDVLGEWAAKYDIEKEFELLQQQNLGKVLWELQILNTPQ